MSGVSIYDVPSLREALCAAGGKANPIASRPPEDLVSGWQGVGVVELRLTFPQGLSFFVREQGKRAALGCRSWPWHLTSPVRGWLGLTVEHSPERLPGSVFR